MKLIGCLIRPPQAEGLLPNTSFGFDTFNFRRTLNLFSVLHFSNLNIIFLV